MIKTQYIIKVYRGWDEVEKPHRIDIIDFDLIPRITEKEIFSSREEVLKRLIELRDSTIPETPDEEFLKARLNASTFYLRALLGEHIPFKEYVKNTMGIRPEIIPDVEIERQKRVVDELLKGFGVPRRKSFKQFTSEIKLEKAEDAEEETRRCEETYVPRVLETLGFSGLEFQHTIKFVEEEAYWMGWVRSLPDGSFELRYNFHPVHQWYRGDLEFLTLHEVAGHFVQAANLKRGIERGELNPAVGITMVHDPHPFGSEGIADAISYFLPEIQLSPYAVLAREQRALRDYLQNNAYISINEGGNENELTAYILENHPFSTQEKVRLNLKRWINDPLLRTYQYIYGISAYYHRRWNEQLTVKAKKAYLRYAFTRYATPQQLLRFVGQLK